MSRYTHHPLSEDHFSYVAVAGTQIELKVGEQTIRFNMQTAEELIDILTGYVEDRFRARDEYMIGVNTIGKPESEYLDAIETVRASRQEPDNIYQARMKARMEVDKSAKETPTVERHMSMEEIVDKVNRDYQEDE